MNLFSIPQAPIADSSEVICGSSHVQVFQAAFGVDLEVRVWIAIILPLLVVCCWIRELEGLTMLSLVANLCIVFALIVILYEILFQLTVGEDEEKAAIRRESLAAADLTNFPLFFGSAVYAFEGIGVVSRGIFPLPLLAESLTLSFTPFLLPSLIHSLTRPPYTDPTTHVLHTLTLPPMSSIH